MLIFRHCTIVLFFIFSISISFAADHPKALIVEHAGDSYAGSYDSRAFKECQKIKPKGTSYALMKQKKNCFRDLVRFTGRADGSLERHKEGYSGTYIYEGEFNGSPYWVQNGCIGEFVVKECRCYIYKQKNTWVLVPQPPGTSGKLYGKTDDWLANAYNDNKWPWEGKWGGSVKSVTINNDINLNKAREEAKINACPVGEKETVIKKPEEKETQGWFKEIISEMTMKARGLKFWVKVPPALYIEHRGDEYGGDMIREGKGGPRGDEPAGYPHAGDYTGTYVLEGKFDGSPYWVQNNCVGGGDACRCYIYKQRDLWVLVPQHPGADNNAWLANAYTDAEFPWKVGYQAGVSNTNNWRGDVASVYFKTSIDKELEYKKRVAIDSCPGEWPPGYKDKNPPIPPTPPTPPTQVDYSGVTTDAKKRLSDGTDVTVSSRDNGEDVLTKIENKDPTELAVNADGSYTSSANSVIDIVNSDADQADSMKTIKIPGGTYTGQTIGPDSFSEHPRPHGFGVFIRTDMQVLREGGYLKNITNLKKGTIKYIGGWREGVPDGYGAEVRTNETWLADPTFYDTGRKNQNRQEFQFHVYIGEYIKGERSMGGIYQIPNNYLDNYGFAFDKGYDRNNESLFYTCQRVDLGCSIAKIKEMNADLPKNMKMSLPLIKDSNIEVVFTDRINDFTIALDNRFLGKYKGKFKNDRASGQGRAWYNDGSHYSGQFKEGAADGGGRKTWDNGESFHGNFKRNLPHGQGSLVQDDGSKYTGDFVNGIATGKGTKRFSDNSSYEGEFVNGQAHGFGTFTDPSGRKLTGTWGDGRLIKRE